MLLLIFCVALGVTNYAFANTFSERYERAERELEKNPALQQMFQQALGWKAGKSMRPQKLSQSLEKLSAALSDIHDGNSKFLNAQALVDEVRKDVKKKHALKIAGAVGAGAVVVGGAALAAHAVRTRRGRSVGNDGQGLITPGRNLSPVIDAETVVMPFERGGDGPRQEAMHSPTTEPTHSADNVGADHAEARVAVPDGVSPQEDQQSVIMPENNASLHDGVEGTEAEETEPAGREEAQAAVTVDRLALHVFEADPSGRIAGGAGAAENESPVVDAEPEMMTRDIGNKAKNSFVLRTIAATLATQFGYTFKVPAFVAISSSAVKTFLGRQGVDVDALWGEIAANPLGGAGEIRQRIAAAFQDFSSSAGVSPRWEDVFGREGKSLDDFLDDSPVGSSFMVRSTGNEDTETITNAGGNETVRVIAPSSEQRFPRLLSAMEKVVVSYIDSKSLTQRRDAGDDITAPPLMPLLVQHRVAEIAGQALPRCGVMYTDEPAGGAFRAVDDTTRLVLVQAAYGDNELVVNSRGLVDSFILPDQAEVYPHIQRKAQRLRATETDVEWVKNDEQHECTPALGAKMLAALKACARACEKASGGKPQDIEFIVMPDEKVIYLLQMRPLVVPPVRILPSYVNPERYKNSSLVRADMAGQGGAYVRASVNRAGMVIAPSLAEAVNGVYASLSADKRGQARIFVVKEMAAVTSHEGNTAMGLKMPVFCLKEQYEAFVGRIEQEPDAQWCADPQAGILFQGVVQEEDLIAGWLRYPLPLVGSFGCTSLFSAKTDISVEQKLPAKPTPFSLMRRYIQRLRTEASQADVVKLCNLLRAAVFSYDKTMALAGPSYQARYNHLLGRIVRLLRSCKQPFFVSNPPGSSSHLAARLYPLHLLDLLLFSQSSGRQHVDQDSLTLLLIQAAREKPAGVQHAPASEQQRVLSAFAEYASSDALAAKWKKFVAAECSPAAIGARSLADNQAFSDLLAMLDDLKLFPQWMHTSFALAQGFDVLVDEFRRHEAFIRQLLKKKHEIESCDPRACADPATFMKTWHQLLQFKDYIQSEAFTMPVSGIYFSYERNPLACGVIASVLLCLIELFDASIKAVTSSDLFVIHGGTGVVSLEEALGRKDKIRLFYCTLFEFVRTVYFLLSLGNSFPLNWKQANFCAVFNVLVGGDWGHLAKRVHTILDECLENTSKNLQDQSQLDVGTKPVDGCFPSPYMEKSLLRSYEAIFTLVHSAIKSLIGIMSGSALASSVFCQDESFRAVHDILGKQATILPSKNEVWFSVEFSPQLLAGAYSSSGNGVHYFVPIRDHSAHLTIFRNKKKKVFEVAFSMAGVDEACTSYVTDGRWHEMKAFVDFYNETVFKKNLFIPDISFNSRLFQIKAEFAALSLRDLKSTATQARRLLEILVLLSYTGIRLPVQVYSFLPSLMSFYAWLLKKDTPADRASWLYVSLQLRRRLVSNHYYCYTDSYNKTAYSYPYYFEGKTFDDCQFNDFWAVNCEDKLRALTHIFFDALLCLEIEDARPLLEFSKQHPDRIYWSEIEEWPKFDSFGAVAGVEKDAVVENLHHKFSFEGDLSDYAKALSCKSDTELQSFCEGLVVSPLMRRLFFSEQVLGGTFYFRLSSLCASLCSNNEIAQNVFAQRHWYKLNDWMRQSLVIKHLPCAIPLHATKKTYLAPEVLAAKVAEARAALGLNEAANAGAPHDDVSARP